ncbi:hypothetical protein WICPIJ_007872 [Wickerhamomyces pijperi]|uniref:Transcriptional regulatory protein n=1 Tax=Wickerhamomyces pijperi TaxID=599730 RepID=A0A9P8Q0W0_WICPI|nr:hypothetical protein WICPIJ_007872 [Wickerhamomyces pijperi]
MLRLSRVSLNIPAPARSFSSTPIIQAGHSKWANIKHDKARNDAIKNKVANKMAKAIAVAAKLGGPDPTKNVRLAAAMEAASKANVVKKVIENAVRRGAGISNSPGEKTAVETVVYEGVTVGNVSLVVEALTDNKNRTFSAVRAAFTKYGGNLPSPTGFLFERKGFIVIEKGDKTYDDVFEEVVDLGAEDLEEIVNDEGVELLEISTGFNDTGSIANQLKELQYNIKEVGTSYVPNEDALIEIRDPDVMERYNKFIATLDEIDDVTDYYTTLKEVE